MITYSTADIASILHTPTPTQTTPVSILLTDSRSLIYPTQSLFFAINTPTNDGHRYIADLYRRGVRAFCVTAIPEEMKGVEDATFFVVPDVTKALQTIARHHRSQFNTPVIGITGSRGKTTVKEWLYQLLKQDYDIVRSPRSYNSQIGVPLSIWEMNSDTTLSIFEAGISLPGEMAQLEAIIRPDLGIITNLGEEHSEGFSSMREKCREKVELLKGCKCIIYDGDDKLIDETVRQATTPVMEIAWSRRDSDRPLYISNVETTEKSAVVTYSYLRTEGRFEVPFTSDFEIQNAIHCLAVMLYLGIPVEEIATRMGRLTPIDTRLEVIEGVNDCLLIRDSYTSDLHSLALAIDFMMRRATNNRQTTVILSDVQHETLQPEKLYRRVADLLRQRGINRVIGIGEEISANSRFFDSSALFYPSTASFLTSASPGDFDSELILIKGASQFHFEMICDMLEASQHETILEVNLDAIVHNFNLFRAALRPTTGIVCMVKASGYGAGSYELAKTLQSQGAAYLAVAVLDEGVDLRKAGITMPIMVLNPKVVNYKTLFAYNLEPEVYDFEMLNEIIREGEKYGITDYPVHIKLDTGMHRLGFLKEDMPELIDILRRQKVVRPISVFSHLAAADDPAMDDYTREQFAYFADCCEMLQQAFPYHIMRHILNSTGITRFPEYQYDMVRLGICLYGIPTMGGGIQDELQRVSSLHTTIISIKEWPAGTTIGYNRRGMLHRTSRIATLPIGYADGIDRHLGNGKMSVWINGHRCPTVGNICMDVCMIDVTDAPCNVGDSVEIFGHNIDVLELAQTLDTIPYEILTSISTRVKRVYYRE